MEDQFANLSSYERRVIDYITQHGGISSKEAVEDLGNGRLSGTIHNLRKKGYNIQTLRIDTENRYGEPTWYGRYVFGHD